jgi:hypothetical protein
VGTYDIHSFRWEAAAIAHALLFNEGTIAAVCPLFRQPQPALTAGEREALEVARDVLGEMEDNDGEPFTPEVDAICGLLQRLK